MDDIADFKRKQYTCSLSLKQMPPTASHLSRGEDKDWLKERKWSDMLINAMAFDVSSVDKFMMSPLLKL